ncbi:hypothetical protein SAY86_021028 [Trapa natans]|uniref:Uncharacterized protein n=1 Tax=Trapa natans TaxID=22666 RepID=A0AAN7MTG0_TRANT|nr:hypothetical protein SAY86_021028 [Trapa natans]
MIIFGRHQRCIAGNAAAGALPGSDGYSTMFVTRQSTVVSAPTASSTASAAISAPCVWRILPDSSNKNTKAEKNADANGGCNLRGNGICRRVIDKDSAKVLVAAARIAAVTMNKAAHTARIEAERRVKEAALARKRAREALERVSFLSLKEKEELKMVVNGGLGTVQEKKMKPRVSNSAQENKQIQSHIPR